MKVCLDMRRTNQPNFSWIDDHEVRAVTEPTLHLGSEDRMALGWVCPDNDENISVSNRIKVLCSS